MVWVSILRNSGPWKAMMVDNIDRLHTWQNVQKLVLLGQRPGSVSDEEYHMSRPPSTPTSVEDLLQYCLFLRLNSRRPSSDYGITGLSLLELTYLAQQQVLGVKQSGQSFIAHRPKVIQCIVSPAHRISQLAASL